MGKGCKDYKKIDFETVGFIIPRATGRQYADYIKNNKEEVYPVLIEVLKKTNQKATVSRVLGFLEKFKWYDQKADLFDLYEAGFNEKSENSWIRFLVRSGVMEKSYRMKQALATKKYLRLDYFIEYCYRVKDEECISALRRKSKNN